MHVFQVHQMSLFESFLNWQIWHFCHSCTKLTSRGFKISKKNYLHWALNSQHQPTIRIPVTLTILSPRHLLKKISLNWTWIISDSIEHDFKRVWKFETGMDWQIGWVGKVAEILIVGLVLWVQYPVEAIFLLILKPRDVNFVQEWQKCQICQFRKNSNVLIRNLT